MQAIFYVFASNFLKEIYGKRQANRKNVERLAKRGERRRQRMLEETAEERDSRLKKRRETWKKRTAEQKGKQKEYNRLYRQQKRASEPPEIVEKRETRLARRREAWQRRNAEKGKQQGCQEANEGSLSLDEAMETNVSATKSRRRQCLSV